MMTRGGSPGTLFGGQQPPPCFPPPGFPDVQAQEDPRTGRGQPLPGERDSDRGTLLLIANWFGGGGAVSVQNSRTKQIVLAGKCSESEGSPP